MVSTIHVSKFLPRDQWGKFFDQLSCDNCRRRISIESISSELGNEELIQNAPLMSIIYDRSGKGDDLVIEVGKDEVTYAHTVDSPTEILTGQNSKGQIIAIWISDASGGKTLIKLQVS